MLFKASVEACTCVEVGPDFRSTISMSCATQLYGAGI